MSDKLNFQADVSKMLNIVVNSLYSEKQIFLRELISNASDACDKLKYMALTHPDIARESGEMKIWITPDAEKNTLTVADNGIGMNRDDLINHLGTIAKSGTADFVKNASDNGSAVDLIGQFGVGFYSAFMVADKVEILTRRAGEDKAWFWVSNGVDGFEIREAEKKTNGTEIKLFLKQDEKNYTDSIYLRQIIRTYSDHINYPIVLCLGKAGEETVNSASALWTRNKAEITPEQYKELLPSYLRFVRGIIDSSDLPLNISREMLQQSPLIAKIRQGTVSRILKELKKRSKDYEDYKKFWDAFGIAFKEGIYEDFANREEIAGLSRFVSTNDTEKLTSLDDYIGRAQPEQKAIYYITGDDVKTLVNNPQLEAFKEKGLEVLLLTDPIDEFWTQTLGTYKTFAVKHVSQADIDLSFKREGQKAEEGDLKKLTDLLGEMFKNEVGKVTTTDKLTKSPVSLTVEAGQMSIHLERLMRNHQQQTAFASTRILELNPYHPLIIRLAEAMGDEALKPKVEEVARLLLDQAKIAEGECISDPSFYSEKMSEYILKSF